MFYRKTPPRAPRLLLRSVAALGVAAVASTTACSGDVSNAKDPVPVCGGHACGVVPQPDDAGNVGNDGGVVGACGGHVCGVVVVPAEDAGQDAGEDASTGPCGGGVCGSIVMHDDAGSPNCDDGGCVAGVVVGIGPLPDASIR